jgi:hypothetical protein
LTRSSRLRIRRGPSLPSSRQRTGWSSTGQSPFSCQS